MQVTAQADAHPIVILPGFGNKTEDYTEPFGSKEDALTFALERRGFQAYTVPVRLFTLCLFAWLWPVPFSRFMHIRSWHSEHVLVN